VADGIVVRAAEPSWSGSPARRGSAVVWWLAVTAAGFVVATGLVIALALPATARWEAEERTAPGHRVVLPPTVRGGAALR
jgi:hypothetical protein